MLSKDRVDGFIREPLGAGLTRSEQMEMATELLSLREQLAELKALQLVGYANQDELDNIEPGVSAAMIYPERDAYSSVPIFTAAKPAED